MKGQTTSHSDAFSKTPVSDPDSFGLRSVDSKLNLRGAIIAESEDVHPNLGVDNGDIKFGDDVSLGTGKCINITLDNSEVTRFQGFFYIEY